MGVRTGGAGGEQGAEGDVHDEVLEGEALARDENGREDGEAVGDRLVAHLLNTDSCHHHFCSTAQPNKHSRHHPVC